MKLCFVTNDKNYSKLFRWLFNEDSSHVGTTFNINGVELATDLNRPYGTLWDLNYWKSKYNIVWSMELKLSDQEEFEIFKACREYAVLRKYDMAGYYYGMVWGILAKFFGLTLPKVNIWAEDTGSMCQEIIVPLVQHPIFKKYVPTSIPVVRTTAKTPGMVRKMMMDATKDNEHITWVYNG